MEKNGVLLVEGKDDLHVIKHLTNIHDIQKSFEIKDFEGIDRLLKAFPIILETGKFRGFDFNFDIERLGIVVDANEEILNRWNKIKTILKGKGYPYKEDMDVNGVIIKDEFKEIPYVGAWIMPDNLNNGMLEDFFRYFIPEHDKLFPRVNKCIDEISNDPEFYTPEPRSKAEIRTWLAWQKKSESLMGYALSDKKEYLVTGNECAIKFINWIKRLFHE